MEAVKYLVSQTRKNRRSRVGSLSANLTIVSEGGTHFSDVVTAALIVLIKNRLTLMHMPRLLTNTEFLEQCLELVTDSKVVEFFHQKKTPGGSHFE